MDTIFALCTPAGKSGVAVIRLSGTHSVSSLHALGISALPAPRQATLAKLSMDRVLIDTALVLYFPAPHSFTGEDVIEYHIHGSRAVIQMLLSALSTLPGLRPAEPGEFARRAFMQGKMDLTAAEGLADLIDAETEAQQRQALRIMQGESAAFYQGIRQDILEALALNEAYIDFPEEDIPPEVLAQTTAQVKALSQLIETQLADKGAAERIRDGVQVVILGPPNAGKSSLMNLLARREVAIVSHTAGTTRDVIEVHLDIGGYAVIIADTAGLRESGDEVEREGIRRSVARAHHADIRIIVLDGQHPDITFAQELPAFNEENTILLYNKIDVMSSPPPMTLEGLKPIAFSARENIGMEALLSALGDRVSRHCSAEASFITRTRHRRHLQQAVGHLQHYMNLKDAGLELQCEELRRAAVEIGLITGAIAVDEVLGQIFSRFCIGK